MRSSLYHKSTNFFFTLQMRCVFSTDFELLLDVVARRLSSDIPMIAPSLFLDQDTVDQILRDNQYYSMQEKIFQILYHWRKNTWGRETACMRH